MESPPKPFIIPVFLPHQGCPHRCIFCDQRAITGTTAMPDNDTVRTQVDRFAAYNRRKRQPVQLSFYGGNFLGLPPGEIQRLLDLAEKMVTEGRINSIRFSTRPDTVTPGRLEILAGYSVTTIELGVQSMDDTILAQAQRGHTAAHTLQALNLLREHGFQTGGQIMIGLPGDDGPSSLATAEILSAHRPDFVRIYPTIVIAGSPLAHRFRRGEYRPLPLKEAVQLAASLRETFSRHGIPVIRMGLQPTAELSRAATVLAGPYHPAFGHLVLSEIAYRRLAARIRDHRPPLPDCLTIAVHPRSISVTRGHRNANLGRLEEAFGFQTVRITGDASLDNGTIDCRW